MSKGSIKFLNSKSIKNSGAMAIMEIDLHVVN